MILPRRSFSPLLGRLLHDRTADKIAGVVSRVPNAAATIIPFDVQNRLRVLQGTPGRPRPGGPRPASLTPVPGPPANTARPPTRGTSTPQQTATAPPTRPSPSHCPAPAATTGPFRRPASPRSAPSGAPGRLGPPWRAASFRVVEVRSVERNSVLAAEIADSTGDLTALFYGRSNIPGLMCGSRVRFRGTVGIKDGTPGHDQPRLRADRAARGRRLRPRIIEPNGPGCPLRHRPRATPPRPTPRGRSARKPG